MNQAWHINMKAILIKALKRTIMNIYGESGENEGKGWWAGVAVWTHWTNSVRKRRRQVWSSLADVAIDDISGANLSTHIRISLSVEDMKILFEWRGMSERGGARVPRVLKNKSDKQKVAARHQERTQKAAPSETGTCGAWLSLGLNQANLISGSFIKRRAQRGMLSGVAA